MNYWLAGTTVLTIALSGCSMWSQDAAEQTEQVANVQTPRVAELEIPAGLKPQRRPSRYDVPMAGQQTDTKQVDIRSPLQVLALATNSRVDEEDKQVRVWFDRTELTGDLSRYTAQGVQQFFAANGIKATEVGSGHWQTDWVPSYQPTGWWLWEGQELTHEARFDIQMAAKPHGREVSLTSQLVEYREQDNVQSLSEIAKHRQEVAFLNRIVDSIASAELVKLRDLKAKQAISTLTLSQQADTGGTVLVSQKPIDLVWTQLESLFEQMSVEVTDMDQSNYHYFIKQKSSGTGFWSSLWGSDDTLVLPLPEGEYQVKLQKQADDTVISWTDKDGKLLDAAVQAQLLSLLQNAARKYELEF